MMRSIIRDLGGKSSTSLRSAQNDTGAPPAISTVGADIIRPKPQKMQKVKRKLMKKDWGITKLMQEIYKKKFIVLLARGRLLLIV